jgi:MFS family permease
MQKNQITPYAIICWFLALLFALMQFDLQMIQGFFTSELSQEFNLNHVGIANLSSAFFYAYLALQIPAGLLFIRYPLRYILTISSLLTALGCFVFAQAESIQIAYLGRIMMGAGCAFAYVGLLVVINQLFPAKYFPFLLGLSEFLSISGAGIMENGFAILTHDYGWRHTLVFSSIIMLLLGLCYYFLFAKLRHQSHYIEESKTSIFTKIRQVLSNKPILLACIFGFGIFAISSGLATLWAVPLLKSAYPFVYNTTNPAATAASIAQMILIGIGVGSVLIGWLSTRFKLANIMLICGIITLAIMIYMILIMIETKLTIALLFFLIGMTCSAYILSFSIAQKYARPGNEALAIAITNLVIVSGNIILQPLIGWLLDWHSIAVNGAVQALTVSDFNFALWVLPVVFALACWSAFALRKYP